MVSFFRQNNVVHWDKSVNSCRPYTESKCITFLTTLKTWKSIVLLFSVNVSWLKGLRETGGCVEKNGYYVRARKVAAYNGATARYFVTALHPPFVNGKGKAPCKCELWSLREKHYNKLHHRTSIRRYHSRYDKNLN